MKTQPDSIFILAAEPSADLHGAHLSHALQSLQPDLKIFAIAGPRMRKTNIYPCGQMEDLQVMGFTDVIKALPRIYRQFKKIRKMIIDLNPRAVVCIDYPGFNLRLEKSLRRHGYQGRLIHYICPTVWAWGKKRIPMMAQNLDLLLTIFPFETECFKKTSLTTKYVGHPLVKKILHHSFLENFHQHYHLDATKKILAIFPGSRKTEIERNFPLQMQAAKTMQKKIPDLQIVTSLSHPQFRSFFNNLTLIEPEHHYDLMKHSHLALATSGTVTLELALFQIPTVVNYFIKPIDVFLAQKIFRINLPYYVIVNILLNKAVFPELFGPNLTLPSILNHAEHLWANEEARLQCKNSCAQVKEILGNTDASQEAALSVLSLR